MMMKFVAFHCFAALAAASTPARPISTGLSRLQESAADEIIYDEILFQVNALVIHSHDTDFK